MTLVEMIARDARESLTPEDVAQIDIKVTPYAYKLTGHQFKIGDNPKVNAQFSIQYCVANALLRGSPKPEHFEEHFIREPQIMKLIHKIHVVADPALEEQGETATELQVRTTDGTIYHGAIDTAPGLPENPLTKEEHLLIPRLY